MYTRFPARKTVIGARPRTWKIVHVREQICKCTLLMTWYDGRNCTKLVLKLLTVKNCLFQSSVLLLSRTLYYFSLHDYPLTLYTTRSIYIVVLPFLSNWNEKWCRESNILTMAHELVLENSSSAAVYTISNTMIYLRP